MERKVSSYQLQDCTIAADSLQICEVVIQQSGKWQAVDIAQTGSNTKQGHFNLSEQALECKTLTTEYGMTCAEGVLTAYRLHLKRNLVTALG